MGKNDYVTDVSLDVIQRDLRIAKIDHRITFAKSSDEGWLVEISADEINADQLAVLTTLGFGISGRTPIVADDVRMIRGAV